MIPVRAVNYPDRTVLVTPFDPQFLARLKRTIPMRYRHYNGDTRQWTILPPYCGRIAMLLRGHWPDAEIVTGDEG